jgi:hypothetical protein
MGAIGTGAAVDCADPAEAAVVAGEVGEAGADAASTGVAGEGAAALALARPISVSSSAAVMRNRNG